MKTSGQSQLPKMLPAALAFLVSLSVSMSVGSVPAAHADIAHAEVKTQAPRAASSAAVEQVLDDFEDGVSGWVAGENVSSVAQVSTSLNPPGQAYEGEFMLELIADGVPGTLWRTAYKDYATPLDLEATPLFTVALNSYGVGPGNEFEARIEFFSGSERRTETVAIQPNGWQVVPVNLRDWPQRSAIDRIAISFRSTTFSDPWGGRHQIDLVSAKDASTLVKQEWTFNEDFDPEGWQAAGNLDDVSVRGGHLNASVTGGDPQLVNDLVAIDAAMIQYLDLHVKNKTAGEQGRLYWRAEGQAGFSQARSVGFELRPNDNVYRQYGVDLSGVAEWSGTITEIRLDVPDAATVQSGQISINTIRFSPYPQEVYHPGTVDAIQATASAIEVSGNVERATPVDVGLIALAPYETYEFGQDYEPLATTRIEPAGGTASFSFSVDRFVGGEDRIYSKYVVVVDDPAQKTKLAPAQYVTVFPAAEHTYPYPSVPTKKGLQVQMVDDAQKLGNAWAALNFVVSAMFATDGEPSIAYETGGETYLFRRSYIENFDKQLKDLSDAGMNVALVVLFIGGEQPAGTPYAALQHPDYQSGTIAAVNTTDEVGTDYWKAAMEFLVERYTREDEQYGRAVDYIIGNEVDAQFQWNDMGEKEQAEYVEQYSRTLRIAYTAARMKYSEVRIRNSLTHFWTLAASADPRRSYPSKDIVDQMNYEIGRAGDIPWNIAHHPYPQNLFDPTFWEDTQAFDNFETPYITFKNLHVLPDYMAQPAFLYEGQPRSIALTEQGFHTPDESLQAQKVQAAAYAYAYYKVRFLDGIDYFTLHRHVDNRNEGGLNLGLWTQDPAANFPASPLDKKYVYDVFRLIDTDSSLAVTEFAKPIIGISDWAAVIPGFNSAALDQRERPQRQPVEAGDPVQPVVAVSTFEEGVNGWTISEYSTDAGVVPASEGVAPYEGDQMLRVAFQKGEAEGGAMAENGITKTYETPLDVSATPRFQLGVNPPGGLPEAERYEVTLRVYSGDFRIAQGTATVMPNVWNTLSMDVSDWTHKDQVTKVKVWFSAATTNTPWGSRLFVDQIGWGGTQAAADATPPVCGAIEIERNGEGTGTAVVSSAADAESGIAEITFTRLENLTGFYDTGDGREGGFEQGDTLRFAPAETPSLEIGGERMDVNQRRAALEVTVTNGAGLSATCDPVISRLSAAVPEAFGLKGNYPNPFRNQTTVAFDVAEPMQVSIEVYDVLGRKVATLVDKELAPSTYQIKWSASGLPSGMYVYRMRAGDFVEAQRMVIVR